MVWGFRFGPLQTFFYRYNNTCRSALVSRANFSMPARKRQSGGTTGRGDAKRKKQQTVSDEQGDEDDFFLASEDEKEAAAGDLEETEERLETAEEKRLRLGEQCC